MPGLSLNSAVSGRVGLGNANYTPVTPASAAPPTATIGTQAFGINGSGGDTGNDNLAWIGSVSVGAIAALALLYLWYSLPR